MNPMLHALKNRKSQSSGESHGSAEHVHPVGGDHTKHLHEFVKSLTPEQKQTVSAMLEGGVGDEQINKGAPASGERGKISEQMAKDNAEEAAEGEGTDSDDIAMGMLDPRFKSGSQSKPRNLHDRVQMNMTQNLKAKGKI